MCEQPSGRQKVLGGGSSSTDTISGPPAKLCLSAVGPPAALSQIHFHNSFLILHKKPTHHLAFCGGAAYRDGTRRLCQHKAFWNFFFSPERALTAKEGIGPREWTACRGGEGSRPVKAETGPGTVGREARRPRDANVTHLPVSPSTSPM